MIEKTWVRQQNKNDDDWERELSIYVHKHTVYDSDEIDQKGNVNKW